MLHGVPDLAVVGEVPGLPRPDDSPTFYTAASAFSADGTLIVGSEAPVLRVVDPATLAVVDEVEVPAFSFNRDVVVAGEVVLGVGSVDIGNVTLVDLALGEVRWALTIEDLGVTGCAASAVDAAREHLYCADYYGRIGQRDLRTGAPTGVVYQSQIGRLGRIEVDPGGTTLAGYGTDRAEIVRWRIDGTGPVIRRIAPGLALDSYNSDGSAATATDYSDPEGPPDGDAAIIEAASGAVIDPLDGWRQPRWLDDPAELLVSRELESGEWQIRRYRVGDGPIDEAFEIRLPAEPMATIVDGGLVATSTPEGEWSFWDAETGVADGDPLPLDPGVAALVVTDDGGRLVTFGRAGTTVVDRRSGEVLVGPRPAPTFGVVTDAEELIGTDPSGALTVYDLDTLEAERKVSDTAGFVQDLRVDAVGATVVTKGGDRSVEVFDLASGVRMGTAHRIPEADESFSHLRPDGAEMAIGGGTAAGTALWSLDPDVWREQLCELAGRNLTLEEWERYLAWSGPYHTTCPAAASADGAAAADDGVWLAAGVPIEQLGVDEATADLLREASGPNVSVELLLRDGRFRMRTADGVMLALGSGAVRASETTLTFVPDDSAGEAGSTLVVVDRRGTTLVLGDLEEGTTSSGTVAALEGATLRRR